MTKKLNYKIFTLFKEMELFQECQSCQEEQIWVKDMRGRFYLDIPCDCYE